MSFLATLKSLSCFSVSKSNLSQDPDQHKPQASQDGSTSNSNASSSATLLLPLIPTSLPYVIPLHQPALASQGWTTITYPAPTDPLLEASEALFRASKAFFALPSSYKEGFQTKVGSEEGWLCVEGEKEFITLRGLSNTPDELKDAAAAYWKEAGGLVNEILGRVAETLGVKPDALTRFSEPCKELQTLRTATMLRLFRYEGFSGQETKIVAQAHKDLGLLSLVIGDTPGLEVWDKHTQRWFQIEKSYEKPSGSLLVGRQLERLSNGKYMAGGHRVRSYPDLPQQTNTSEKNYRYSIVFVLRAHSPVVVNTDALTTPITGKFQSPIRDIEARQLFKDIQRAHFNINTNHEEREQQRLRLLEKKNSSIISTAVNTVGQHNENDQA